MVTLFKFVKGRGDQRQIDALQAASKEGYEVKGMSIDSSQIGLNTDEQVVVLLEKKE